MQRKREIHNIFSKGKGGVITNIQKWFKKLSAQTQLLSSPQDGAMQRNLFASLNRHKRRQARTKGELDVLYKFQYTTIDVQKCFQKKGLGLGGWDS